MPSGESTARKPVESETRPDAKRAPQPSGPARPFDPSAFERLPKPTEKDPPYRPWWVVD